MRRFLLILAACCFAQQLEISRPARTWEFADAVGPRAGVFGTERGTFEGYVYPLKVFRDLRLVFISDGREIPGADIARRIVSTPGTYSLVYSADDFRVTATLAVPVDSRGALIRLLIDAQNPVRINVRFARDFQLMWPASFGSAFGDWNGQEKVFRFGADGQPYAAVLGSPDAILVSREYATNYSSEPENSFSLGVIKGKAERVIAFAASIKSLQEALASYRELVSRPNIEIADTERYYSKYLDKTVRVELPDKALQEAYDRSRVSILKGFVDNPLLGKGMVAGYGPSKGAYRPGFGWFFGRDSFWTSFALTAAGDWEDARTAISFVARFQREDGKIPHEISQSASLVPWFKDFPYGYNAADATPLYAIAIRDYVQASGDVAFAREQAPHLWKGLDFMRSTLDPDGFPANLDVGPGWVEGGPLLPVRLEIYQAACYVESLRSLAWLARVLNDEDRARTLDAEFAQKRAAMDKLFWRANLHSYAFAIDPKGKPVDEPSVLATVPMWFHLLDEQHSREMIGLLAQERHASDWGMRIISSASPLYDPSGYHFGSVWPLFTGWASVGEYQYHQAQQAFANLKANAGLSSFAGGNITEVLSGATATPLSTASPHQIWSAAMVVSPVLRGMAGLEADAVHNWVRFTPHLPADWSSFAISGIRSPSGSLSLELHRDRDTLTLTVTNSGTSTFDFEFAPAYPPCAHILSARLAGTTLTWAAEAQTNDVHPRFRFPVHSGKTQLQIRHSGMFGYVVPLVAPRLAEPSSNMKVIAEHWSDQGSTLALTVSGLAGAEYRLHTTGSERIRSVSGASKESNGDLVIRMPPGDPGGYISQEITVRL